MKLPIAILFVALIMNINLYAMEGNRERALSSCTKRHCCWDPRKTFDTAQTCADIGIESAKFLWNGTELVVFKGLVALTHLVEYTGMGYCGIKEALPKKKTE